MVMYFVMVLYERCRSKDIVTVFVTNKRTSELFKKGRRYINMVVTETLSTIFYNMQCLVCRCTVSLECNCNGIKILTSFYFWRC